MASKESHVSIRAVQGRGISDSFVTVDFPVEDKFERNLEAVGGSPTLSDKYADTTAVVIIVTPGTEPDLDNDGDQSLEYAAVWSPARSEWIGVKVRRTKIYEGQWQGIDEIVKCEGPFKLSDHWGQIIQEVHESKRFLTPTQALHTEPSQL